MNTLPAEGESLSPRARTPDYKINAETGCWEWLKALHRGYGTGSFTAVGIATQYAHRAYYMVAHGITIEPGNGRVIDHLCRNPRCVNPEHLELVKPALNSKRGDTAKLTEEQAEEIKRRLATGEALAAIGDDFGITEHCVWTISSGIAWRDDYSAAPVPIRPERYCLECGTLITTGRRHKKFCTPEHREKWNSRRVSRRRRGKDPDGSDVRTYSRVAPRDSQAPKEDT